jgi:hypothetical protein
MSTSSYLLLSSGILFFVALCVESWFSWRFLRRLKRDFPRLWGESGERTIWTDSDLTSAWPTIRFLWYREYEALGTREEIAFCEKYRLPVVVSWAAAGLSIALFFALIFVSWLIRGAG